MFEAQGGSPLERIAAHDAARAEYIERQKQLTLRRRGHKGTRTWGYTTPNSGKRGKRRA